MPALPTWERTKTGSKKGFDKVWALADKLGAPVNKLSNKLGAEAFWPTTLDKESDKAARILRSFCKDGFYEEEVHQTQDGPKQKQKVLKKIPEKVIANAKGLAIFTTMRSGLWVSGAGGSGILVGRKPDGSWSPPSGIMLHTAGLGFLVGVDIYDCVVVINTQEALDAFTKIRCTLGAEVSAVAGPVGAGGILESELHKRHAPIWTYLKSRGFYAGVQIDGTVIIERTDENERFYGEKIGVRDIMAGKVRHPPYEIRMLMETIKAAQGDQDADESALPDLPAPGDMEVERSDHVFGVPDREDPDPYGVLALEKEGLEIREAGSRSRPASEQFDFRPSPTSPVFNNFNRKSIDSHGGRRQSLLKRQSADRSTQTDIRAAQTDGLPSTPVRGSVDAGRPASQEAEDADDVSGPHINIVDDTADTDEDSKDDESAQAENLEVHEPVQAAPQVITKARLVSIPKRIPPALPPRSPARRKVIVNGDSAQSEQQSSSPPPTVDASTSSRSLAADAERDGWSEVALNGDAAQRRVSTESPERKDDEAEAHYAPIVMHDSEDEGEKPDEIDHESETQKEPEHESEKESGKGSKETEDTIEGSTPTSTLAPVSSKGGEGSTVEEDTFHSVPGTPD